jgi:hypothetical protein
MAATPRRPRKTRTELSHLAAGGKTSRFANRFRDRDGEFRWISWKAVPDGSRIYAMERDITELKDAENKLRETRRELALVGRRTTLLEAAPGMRAVAIFEEICRRRELGQDWFQDGRKLPNIFKTRGDVS